MGGSPDTTSTVYQSSLPEYARPYYESLMTRGFNESNRPYQPYQGQRIAGQSDDTSYGLGMAGDFARSSTGYTPYASDLAMGVGMAGMRQAGAAPYMGPVGGDYQARDFTSPTLGYGQGPFGTNQVTAGQFDQNARDMYMSPYMADVVGRAKMDVARNTQEEQVLRNSQAAAAGAFGGSRAAVQNQMAINAAQERMMDLDVQGRQSAFENAQQQFERDRGARMTAEQANQQASLQMAMANRDAEFQRQQLGEQSRQFAFGANQDAYKTAAEMGLAGGQLAQGSAGLISDLQKSSDEMILNRIKAQLGIGQTKEDYTQQSLDTAYNDFVNQRDAGRQNLQFLSSLLQGVPVSANQDVATTTPSNPLAGGIGTLAGLQALYQLGRT